MRAPKVARSSRKQEGAALLQALQHNDRRFAGSAKRERAALEVGRNIPPVKVCAGCKRRKDWREFALDASASDGLRALCAACAPCSAEGEHHIMTTGVTAGPERAAAAYATFEALGASRSLDALAQYTGVPESDLRTWYEAFNWGAQVAEYDELMAVAPESPQPGAHGEAASTTPPPSAPDADAGIQLLGRTKRKFNPATGELECAKCREMRVLGAYNLATSGVMGRQSWCRTCEHNRAPRTAPTPLPETVTAGLDEIPAPTLAPAAMPRPNVLDGWVSVGGLSFPPDAILEFDARDPKELKVVMRAQDVEWYRPGTNGRLVTGQPGAGAFPVQSPRTHGFPPEEAAALIAVLNGLEPQATLDALAAAQARVAALEADLDLHRQRAVKVVDELGDTLRAENARLEGDLAAANAIIEEAGERAKLPLLVEATMDQLLDRMAELRMAR